MTLKGGTSQACAACKYQRRKCTPDCPLAPYFPPDQPKMFQNVHKLFGVKKIQKLLQVLHPSQQNEAMSSIIYQANVRDRSPVYGCCEVIQVLQNQIRQCEEELYTAHAMLAMYRPQHDQQQISPDAPLLTDVTSKLQLGATPPTNDAPSFSLQNPLAFEQYNSDNNVVPISHNHPYSSTNGTYNASHINSKETLLNPMWIQHPGISDNNVMNDNPVLIQSQLVTSQEPAIEQEVFDDYDDMDPDFDTIDDRQSYIDSKEAFDLSIQSTLKDTTHFNEHVAENELKNAAACFSLTSVH